MRPMTDTERKCMMAYKAGMDAAKEAMEMMMGQARVNKDGKAMLAAHRAFKDLHAIHCDAGDAAMTVFSDADSVVLATARGPGR